MKGFPTGAAGAISNQVALDSIGDGSEWVLLTPSVPTEDNFGPWGLF